MKKFAPRTFLGFPIGDDPEDLAGQKDEKNKSGEKGIAIIIALFMIAVMTLFMADMQINAVVESEIATANRDNVKAEYIAKSGANLATFLLSVDLAIDLSVSEMGGDKIPVSDGPGDIWAQLNNIPIGGETLDLMSQMTETFDLSKVADSAVLDQMKLFEGSFTINVTDESSRININYCGHVNRSQRKTCQTFMKALMSCPAEKAFLDDKKLNSDELIGYIEDWIDDNNNANENTGKSSESDAYSDRIPKVQPKNAPLDSLDEMRMIAGWDADMQAVFSPFLTVYPVPYKEQQMSQFQVNFNTAPRELLNCLFPKATLDCADKSAIFLNNRADSAAASSSQAVQQALSETFCADGEGSKYFTYRSDTYRVTVEATAGDQRKRLNLIVGRRLPDDQDTKNNYRSAYKYLYWKMM